MNRCFGVLIILVNLVGCIEVREVIVPNNYIGPGFILFTNENSNPPIKASFYLDNNGKCISNTYLDPDTYFRFDFYSISRDGTTKLLIYDKDVFCVKIGTEKIKDGQLMYYLGFAVGTKSSCGEIVDHLSKATRPE